MSPVPQHALAFAIDALRDARDILDERVDDTEIPRWCRERGWQPFLAALSDAEVARGEAEGLGAVVGSHPAAPPELQALAERVREATRLDAARGSPGIALPGSARRVSPSKRQQLEGLVRLCEPLVRRAARVVDVGSGHGHLARWVAELFGVPAIGLERIQARVETAQRLLPTGAGVRFQVRDLLDEPWPLRPGDLAVGLHACGELSDATTMAAARAGCDLALVSCCYQKIRGEQREPLSAPLRQTDLVLRREVLGLANLASREQGVAGSITDMMQARRSRLALRLLLRERGVALRPGDEMRGINRRRAYGALESLAVAALRARELPGPGPSGIERAAREARCRFEQIRRFSLPRNMLAPLLEVLIALDRASVLAEHGLDARVVRVFAETASPRNLAVVTGR